MKINHIYNAGLNSYRKNTHPVDEMKQSSFQAKDKVEISSMAKELQQISPQAAKRQEKVEAIKVSIENGTYKLDARETAKSIINFYKKN
ncbi:MAG: flagellar biosynthesis anti-sigma factor FlgM [Bacillus sp. (in: firmicutes)]